VVAHGQWPSFDMFLVFFHFLRSCDLTPPSLPPCCRLEPSGRLTGNKAAASRSSHESTVCRLPLSSFLPPPCCLRLPLHLDISPGRAYRCQCNKGGIHSCLYARGHCDRHLDSLSFHSSSCLFHRLLSCWLSLLLLSPPLRRLRKRSQQVTAACEMQSYNRSVLGFLCLFSHWPD
jgi:hypothetical protein